MLRVSGYDIATLYGKRIQEINEEDFGIIKPRPPVNTRFLGIPWKKKRHALFLSTVFTNNQEWEVFTYGPQQELTDLILSFTVPQGIHLTTKLGTIYQRVSAYS